MHATSPNLSANFKTKPNPALKTHNGATGWESHFCCNGMNSRAKASLILSKAIPPSRCLSIARPCQKSKVWDAAFLHFQKRHVLCSRQAIRCTCAKTPVASAEGTSVGSADVPTALQRRPQCGNAGNGIGMSRETTHVLSAEAADVLAADTTHVAPEDTRRFSPADELSRPRRGS